jgi:hypothetical protein
MPAARAQSKKTPPKKPADFDVVFARLRSILVPYAQRLEVKEDTSAYYYLETKTAVYKGKPGFFAAVRKGKNYVSFHLMACTCSRKCSRASHPRCSSGCRGNLASTSRKSTRNYSRNWSA